MEHGWNIYVSHDCCNDFTWGNDEYSTKDNLAEILRAHLDEMNDTDVEEPDERDHYTSTTFVEIVSFLDKYPERKAEVVARAKEGRLTMSPWYCNTLWGSMSPEGTLRSMSSARLLELQTGVPINIGNHSEMPSLPIGIVPILAGAGVDWVVVPWLLFDTVYKTLECPPVFKYRGPDGSDLHMVFDQYASARGLYIQGQKILNHPDKMPEWLSHYQSRTDYPMKAFFAAGTHHDLYPETPEQIKPFNQKLKDLNRDPKAPARLVNASFTRFVEEVGRPHQDQLPVETHSFGISWEGWPVAFAKAYCDYRVRERAYYSEEALLAITTASHPLEGKFTEAARNRADTSISMLGEHAWNGMNKLSQSINENLRRHWANELSAIAMSLRNRAVRAILTEQNDQFTLFNPLGHRRRGLVITDSDRQFSISENWLPFDQQDIYLDGKWRRAFVTPEIDGFGFHSVHESNPLPTGSLAPVTSSGGRGRHFDLSLCQDNSGIASLVHRATGTELRVGPRNIGQLVWNHGEELSIPMESTKLLGHGPVLTQWQQTANGDGLKAIFIYTLYESFDHVDIDVRITKTKFHEVDRLTQVFPCAPNGSAPRVQTPGAYLRAAVGPEGDLHSGADLTRIAADTFFQLQHPQGTVSVATLEAYLLRPHLETTSLQLMGNDINRPEVSPNQGDETEFRFRTRIRFDQETPMTATVATWAAEFGRPILMMTGKLEERMTSVTCNVDGQRATNQCLKPAMDGAGLIARYWEGTGSSEPLELSVTGVIQAFECDLLERNKKELPVVSGKIQLPIRGWGFAGIRLVTSP
jgi:hypothetical protein